MPKSDIFNAKPAPFSKIFQFLSPAENGFIGIVAAYILICAVIAVATGYGHYFRPFMYLNAGVTMTFNLVMIYVLYRLMRAAFLLIKHKPKEPSEFLLADLKKGPFNPALYRRALPIFITFFFFFSTFTSVKMLVPRIHDFSWDEFFVRADVFLHFGFDPWRLLMAFTAHPLTTYIISLVYILWLPVFFVVLYWQLFRLKDPLTRMRFFYTFVLSWAINGTFLALIFSSAGPCYYGLVTGSEHFLDLMDYLRWVDGQYEVYALHTQDLLWNNFQKNDVIVGGGISAFPSVHVATAFLFVLLGAKTGKKTFIAFLIFFGFILVGSVHLGWHYAVDGYFAILTTYALWWLTGRFLSASHVAASPQH